MCKCKDGFEGDGNVECRDIDECLSNTACGSNSICINSVGNYTCECQSGFEGDPYTGCADIDECRLNPCGKGTKCTNLIGDFQCQCEKGLKGDPYSTAGCHHNWDSQTHSVEKPRGGKGGNIISPGGDLCPGGEDISCGRNARCQALSSGYACACKNGFSGNPYKECFDVDECQSKSLHKCGVGAVCINLSPGYRCDCPTGYSGDGRFSCEPIDVKTVCSSDFDCTNNAVCSSTGTCLCRTGFIAEGSQCIDINECLNERICGPSSSTTTCVNIPGSFRCECVPPMLGNPPSKPCRDPCSEVNCGQHADCLIENNEAFCVCKDGWTYNPKEISSGCLGEKDFGGAFNEFYNKYLLIKISDIDECDKSLGPNGKCGENAVCSNTPGGYLCDCKEGYLGNAKVGCYGTKQKKNNNNNNNNNTYIKFRKVILYH